MILEQKFMKEDLEEVGQVFSKSMEPKCPILKSGSKLNKMWKSLLIIFSLFLFGCGVVITALKGEFSTEIILYVLIGVIGLLTVIIWKGLDIRVIVEYKNFLFIKEVTWYEDYVEVILSGEEQFDEQVILYFDGMKEIQQLTDIAVDYPSGEELDESRVITEQSFDVDLNGWGEVRFVSYLPTYDTLWEDVSFVLAKDNQIVYHFPAYFENNSTENDSVGMFDSVEAVGFQDIDGDDAKDVIVIVNYITGAGPQGMISRKTIRIFSWKFQSYLK